jgi:hypothetical protein
MVRKAAVVLLVVVALLSLGAFAWGQVATPGTVLACVDSSGRPVVIGTGNCDESESVRLDLGPDAFRYAQHNTIFCPDGRAGAPGSKPGRCALLATHTAVSGESYGDDGLDLVSDETTRARTNGRTAAGASTSCTTCPPTTRDLTSR